MLKLDVLMGESFNEETEEFLYDIVTLELEHSLVSLSKWESHFLKPFLGSDEKTTDETLWYIRAMVLSPDIPPEVFENLTSEHYNKVNEYISAPMTATRFTEQPNNKRNREIITAEIIYHWMITSQIPFDCENWHLNRLIALVRVCNAKNSPPKKMSPAEIARRNRDLNAQRKAQLNTKG